MPGVRYGGRRMIQQTSLRAFEEIRLSNLGERQKQVLEALKSLGSANNMMLSKKIGIPINCVTGRTRDLVKLGLVEEIFKAKCPITNKMTIFWKVKR